MSVTSPPSVAEIPAQPVTLSHGKGWLAVTFVTLLTLLFMLVLHHDVVSFTAAKWEENETFTHGFLIFPISAWLIWTRRKEIAKLSPSPNYWGLLLLVLLGILFELGDLARVMVVQQYSLVAMVPVAVWTLLGSRVAWSIAFPLGFLFFAVPFGEVLLPPLREFTADFAVTALQLTGIPVYREGNFFSIPSGNWSVVEACSGLRYLIASLTLGMLYAYLTYRSRSRQIVFVILSIIVPIIANGLRAYMIVMIGHLSDMRLAVGVDHIIYGWVFFGIVMLLLFWAGSFWREDLDPQDTPRQGAISPTAPAVSIKPIVFTAIGVMLLSVLWPMHTQWLEKRIAYPRTMTLHAPADTADWQKSAASLSKWAPHFKGAKASLVQTYTNSNGSVSLYLDYYRLQRQGSELINEQNVLVSTADKVWGNVGESKRSLTLNGKGIRISETRLRSPYTRLLVWHMFWIDGQYTVNPYMAKFLEAKSKFLGHGDDAAVVMFAAAYEDDPESARKILTEAIGSLLPEISATLNNSASGTARPGKTL